MPPYSLKTSSCTMWLPTKMAFHVTIGVRWPGVMARSGSGLRYQ